MRDGDRTAFAAIESLIGASLTIAGFLAFGAGGFMAVIGTVLALFGAAALAQAVAVGLGLLTPPQHEPEDDETTRRGRRR
jgi:hypothetical protein